MAHEILVDLFKNRPSLGAELLVEALRRLALPSYTEARLASIDLTQIQPAEYRADVVVLLLDGDVPVWVLIIEVQLGVDSAQALQLARVRDGRRAPATAVRWACSSSLPTPTSPRGAQSRSRPASPASSCARRCWGARPSRS